MQPLKILAFIIGALPLAAFLLTLWLTEGAPLQPLAPGEESRPAAATHPLPQSKLERQGSVAATGHSGTDDPVDQSIAEEGDAEGAFLQGGSAKPAPIVNVDRDAQIFMTLFGVRHPD